MSLDKNPTGLDWDTCQGVLSHKAERMGWSMCIGAGSSRGLTTGVFPDWPELVKRLMEKDNVIANPEIFYSSLGGFSPDALIEAARDRLMLTDSKFARRLQRLLYEDLKCKAGPQWSEIAKCLTAASPAGQNRSQWKRFRDFFTTEYGDLCALQLARVVANTAGKGREPAAIISFNAEPLLYALINAERALSQNEENPPKELRMFNRVSRGISYQEAGRLPYIFCHGLLEIEGGHKIFADVVASTEKLVFSEASYLRLATSSFSWQSAIFLGTAVLRSMVFIGVSFTDPNMRRWLASVHANRAMEWKIKGIENLRYEHFWLHRDPKDEAKKLWIESLVRHLGVRLVWIPAYNDVEAYLRHMLSLDE